VLSHSAFGRLFILEHIAVTCLICNFMCYLTYIQRVIGQFSQCAKRHNSYSEQKIKSQFKLRSMALAEQCKYPNISPDQ
jgi:hypothetical protein